jgi:hypothetical protein
MKFLYRATPHNVEVWKERGDTSFKALLNHQGYNFFFTRGGLRIPFRAILVLSPIGDDVTVLAQAVAEQTQTMMHDYLLRKLTARYPTALVVVVSTKHVITYRGTEYIEEHTDNRAAIGVGVELPDEHFQAIKGLDRLAADPMLNHCMSDTEYHVLPYDIIEDSHYVGNRASSAGL